MTGMRGGNLGHAELPRERVIFHLDDGSVVSGQITIPRRGMRMSDFLAGTDREYLNVADATLTLPGDESEYTPFIMVARKAIRMVKPVPRDEAEAEEAAEAAARAAAWEVADADGGEPEPVEEPGDELPKTGIYPPRNPARHLNRPPSGIHQAPEDVAKKPS